MFLAIVFHSVIHVIVVPSVSQSQKLFLDGHVVSLAMGREKNTAEGREVTEHAAE